METTKPSLFQKFLKFLVLPTIIANLIKSLTMDDQGFSLKKLGFVYSTYKAGQYTDAIISKPTFTMSAGLYLVGFWLIYGGILVGIYSFGDISNGLSKIKGGNSNNDGSKP